MRSLRKAATQPHCSLAWRSGRLHVLKLCGDMETLKEVCLLGKDLQALLIVTSARPTSSQVTSCPSPPSAKHGSLHPPLFLPKQTRMNELLADLWLPLESFNPSMFELLDIFKIGFFHLTDLGPTAQIKQGNALLSNGPPHTHM